jgi:hypothetical protein
MGLLYGRAGRLTAKNGGFRPGQWDELRRRGEEKVRHDRARGVPEHESLRAMLRCLAGLPPTPAPEGPVFFECGK